MEDSSVYRFIRDTDVPLDGVINVEFVNRNATTSDIYDLIEKINSISNYGWGVKTYINGKLYVVAGKRKVENRMGFWQRVKFLFNPYPTK